MPLSDNLAMQNAIAKIKFICDRSQGRSQFFPFGGSGYKASVTHYFNSSTEISTCAVQPGSVEDLQSIVKVIADTRVLFAIKCGGHSTNPGFSSTRGIQIYLVRLNKITVRKEAETKIPLVDVGAGCLFEELYRALAPHNLNIVGGSGLAGVGVTGWMLGGGYSTKTSQYGLGIDNIEAAKIVLPNGDFKEASAKTNRDLFWAIKGGGNNFGIITEFTLRAHDQGKYYDFLLRYKYERRDEVKLAIANFVEKTDNKANIAAAFRHHNNPGGVESFLTVSCVYDGTLPTEDPFKEFIDIEHTIQNYGDPYPLPDPNESESLTETRPFYVTDTLRSLENETYDLGELPQELKQPKLKENKFNVSMSGPVLTIAQSVDGGGGSSAFRAPPAVIDKPKLPMAGISQFPRGRWGNVMVDKFTPGIIKEIEDRSLEASEGMVEHGGMRVGIGLWPFTEDMFNNATPSAWPHKSIQPNYPIIVYFTWEGENNDAHWITTMKSTLKKLRHKVRTDRPSSLGLPYFISTAFAGPEASRAAEVVGLYRDNLGELKELREKYDPMRVMNLTGGFKIPYPASLTGTSAESTDAAKKKEG